MPDERPLNVKTITMTVEYNTGHTISCEIRGITMFEATLERDLVDVGLRGPAIDAGPLRGRIVIEGLAITTVTYPGATALPAPAPKQIAAPPKKRLR